jgi:hypothetical protein
MTLRVAQESHRRAKDWWDWSVWMEGTPKELDGVAHVMYTLHPTFPDPVRRVASRRNKFRLDSSGWGEFEIFAEIVRKDGTRLKRKHWLTFDEEDESPTERRGVKRKEPTAYISSGSADAVIARKLADALSGKGIRVLSPEDAGAGIPLDKAVDRTMSKADIAIFVLSARPNLWMYSEIERALAHNVRHIVPVVIGAGIELPPRLEGRQAIQVSSAQELSAIVDQVLETSLGKSANG